MANPRKIVLTQAGAGLRALRLNPAQRGWAASSVETCADLTDEEGALKGFRATCAGGEVALALRTSSALVKVVDLPAAARDALTSAAEAHMDRLSPFGSGEQTTGHEVLAEEDGSLAVLVAGAPGTLFKTWDALLPIARAGLPGRVDLAILGAWRQLRERHADMFGGRKLALVEIEGEWNLVLARDGVPRYIRGIAPATENGWRRDLRLSLLSAEAELGPGRVDEVLVFSNGADGPSNSLLMELCGCGVRRATCDTAADALEGCARRCLEKKSLNLLPAAWVAARRARAASRNFNLGIAAAAALWVALTATLFGGPEVVKFFIKLDQDKIKAHDGNYQIVNNFRQRVLLIDRYKDRSKSALEALRVIVESMPPETITLTAVNYQGVDGVRIEGESTGDRDAIYAFKETLQKSPPFVECDFNGSISTLPNRRDRFALDARFVKKEAPQ